jgi:hypothetical protein
MRPHTPRPQSTHRRTWCLPKPREIAAPPRPPATQRELVLLSLLLKPARG